MLFTLMRGLVLAGALGLAASPVGADDPLSALKIARVSGGDCCLCCFDLVSLDGTSVQLADMKGESRHREFLGHLVRAL